MYLGLRLKFYFNIPNILKGTKDDNESRMASEKFEKFRKIHFCELKPKPNEKF